MAIRKASVTFGVLVALRHGGKVIGLFSRRLADLKADLSPFFHISSSLGRPKSCPSKEPSNTVFFKPNTDVILVC